jgi:mercuric ion transport protein
MTFHNSTDLPPASDAAFSTRNSAGGILATLGVATGFGAVLACSCCVLPLFLGGLGAGAWVFGTLEVLAPIRIPLLILSALAVAGAWGVYYFRKQPVARVLGATCEAPRHSRITLALLGLGTILVTTAGAWGFIEPVVLKLMRAV